MKTAKRSFVTRFSMREAISKSIKESILVKSHMFVSIASKSLPQLVIETIMREDMWNTSLIFAMSLQPAALDTIGSINFWDTLLPSISTSSYLKSVNRHWSRTLRSTISTSKPRRWRWSRSQTSQISTAHCTKLQLEIINEPKPRGGSTMTTR